MCLLVPSSQRRKAARTPVATGDTPPPRLICKAEGAAQGSLGARTGPQEPDPGWRVASPTRLRVPSLTSRGNPSGTPVISCPPSGLQRREKSFGSECERVPLRRGRRGSTRHTESPRPVPHAGRTVPVTPVPRAGAQSQPRGISNREAFPPADLRPWVHSPGLGAGTTEGREEGPQRARAEVCESE